MVGFAQFEIPAAYRSVCPSFKQTSATVNLPSTGPKKKEPRIDGLIRGACCVRQLELVPEELVVDLVVELDFRGFDVCSKEARAAVG